MSKQVFISYHGGQGDESRSSYKKAEELYVFLKDRGIDSFLYKKENNEDFYDAIDKGLRECNHFVLVACNKDMLSEWVRDEVKQFDGLRKIGQKSANCLISAYIFGVITEEDLYNFNTLFTTKDIQRGDAGFEKIYNSLISKGVGESNNTAIGNDLNDLEFKVKKILGISNEVATTQTSVERTHNKYFSAEDKKEIKRLRIQMNILKNFDGKVYEEVANSYSSLKVLDLGSNCGDSFVNRFADMPNLVKAIGIEYDKASVEKANANYGSDIFKFYDYDVEAEDFPEKLEEICEIEGIEKFDVINIAMLILHLKKPYGLLKTVRKFLAPGGRIIIRDIDDGFNVAYPDKEKVFAETIRICSESEFSGYRFSGREIYTMLKDTGYNDVKLENLGLSTAGMNYDEREALFDTYFGFIIEDVNLMIQKYPEKQKYKKYHEWLKANYDKLESEFMRDDFFFVLGFVLFTAKK